MLHRCCTDGLMGSIERLYTKMNSILNENSWTLKFDNFSHFQNVISNNTSTCERHYDALRMEINMWINPYSKTRNSKVKKIWKVRKKNEKCSEETESRVDKLLFLLKKYRLDILDYDLARVFLHVRCLEPLNEHCCSLNDESL